VGASTSSRKTTDGETKLEEDMTVSEMDTGRLLLQRMLSSQAKAEILFLFHRSPDLIDTLEGIAEKIGRDKDETSKEVEDLENLGVLNSLRRDNVQVFVLDRYRDRQILRTIAKYIRNLEHY